MDNSFEQVLCQLPPWFQAEAKAVPVEKRETITELRLFCGQPAVWVSAGACFCYDMRPLRQKEIDEIFYAVCQDSVHTFQQEICQGYVTMQGGHRVGICGTAVYHNGIQSGLREISSLNIRFARQVKGCSRELHQQMRRLGLEEGNFLLVGAPGCGKTTLLRDYARILAGGDGDECRIVALLDEREELSGGFDLGRTAHVLKGIPKEKAILQALRTLAPQVIVCDEIGTAEEARLLTAGLHAGCHFIGTIHGESWQNLCDKPQFRPFWEQKALDALVFVEKLGQVRKIQRLKEDRHETDRLRTDFSLRAAAGSGA